MPVTEIGQYANEFSACVNAKLADKPKMMAIADSGRSS